MNKRFGLVLAAVLAATVCALWLGRAGAAGGAKADDPGDAVRAAQGVIEKYKDAVVEVRMVLKTKRAVAGREMDSQEEKTTVNGTVIDPSGLTVISNVATDPMARFGLAGLDVPGFKMETSVTDAKIVLADGKEYPAKVVLRDKDLDLAFVRPDMKGLKLTCIEMKAPPAEVKALDEMIGLTRLERSANREPAVAVGRVMSVITKPRTHYMAITVLDSGCPAFDAKGNVVGISLTRISDVKMSATNLNLLGLLPAVLPCADILEAAKQVPAAGADKESKAETKPK